MSPTRLISAFLARKRDQLAELQDEGGLFEIRFLDRLVRREQVAVAKSAIRASDLDCEVGEINEQLARDLAPDDDTPGVLDATELVRLQGSLNRLGHHAEIHTAHLQQLV